MSHFGACVLVFIGLRSAGKRSKGVCGNRPASSQESLVAGYDEQQTYCPFLPVVWCTRFGSTAMAVDWYDLLVGVGGQVAPGKIAVDGL